MIRARGRSRRRRCRMYLTNFGRRRRGVRHVNVLIIPMVFFFKAVFAEERGESLSANNFSDGHAVFEVPRKKRTEVTSQLDKYYKTLIHCSEGNVVISKSRSINCCIKRENALNPLLMNELCQNLRNDKRS